MNEYILLIQKVMNKLGEVILEVLNENIAIWNYILAVLMKACNIWTSYGASLLEYNVLF